MTAAERSSLASQGINGPEELVIYASGVGALSFVWVAFDYKSKCEMATGRSVTMNNARAFIAYNERGKRLKGQGWRLWGGYSYPIVVGPVQRTGECTLTIGDDAYSYSPLVFILSDSDNEIVKNLDMIAQAQFFLDDEEALNSTPPEN